MTDEFILTIEYKNTNLDLPAILLLQGYSHKFKVTVNEQEVYFEPDEEGHYRAVKMPGQEEAALAKIDKELLRTIQEKIETILA